MQSDLKELRVPEKIKHVQLQADLWLRAIRFNKNNELTICGSDHVGMIRDCGLGEGTKKIVGCHGYKDKHGSIIGFAFIITGDMF